MKILLTGAAGFIGSSVALRLLQRKEYVVGIDNHNSYYDPNLKEARLENLSSYTNYKHYRIDLSDRESVQKIFLDFQPQRVINLAAQAGVRHSIDDPYSYISSNVMGFLNVLEGCRNNKVEHLVYASSSSVYGANTKMPFSTHDSVDHPLSLYAVSKKSNELMAHAYSNLYNLPTTGLRFFTVYGPWGRPDMALFKFTKAILSGEKIRVFNYGKHRRDFTYISDIVEGIVKVLDSPATPNSSWNSDLPDPGSSKAPWKIYNIGNNKPVELMDYIRALEKNLGKNADLEMLPLQLGDVPDTYADISDLEQDFEFRPKTEIGHGISEFVSWYRSYYRV